MPKKGTRQPESKASKRRLDVIEQDTAALALRRSGLGYREIGERMGIPQSTAYDSVMRALADAIENRREEADKLRQLEVERLDELLASLWPRAVGKREGADARPNPQLIDRALRVMERRAKLLGLDMPSREESVDLARVIDEIGVAGDKARDSGDQAGVERAAAALGRIGRGEDAAAVYSEWRRGGS